MTRRNLFEQDLEDQKKEEEEKLLLDNVGFYALAVSSTSIIYFCSIYTNLLFILFI